MLEKLLATEVLMYHNVTMYHNVCLDYRAKQISLISYIILLTMSFEPSPMFFKLLDDKDIFLELCF